MAKADEKKKSTKHLDEVGTLDEFYAPWETDSGETEINKDRLRKYIYNLIVDKAKAQDARADAEAAVTEADEAVKAAEKKLADSDSTGELAKAIEERDAAKIDAEEAMLDLARIKVGDEAGLTIKQSLRLQGKDEDELRADAEEILETFGVKKAGDEDPEETDEEREEREEREAEEAEAKQQGNPLRRAPLRNPADSRSRIGSQSDTIDIAKAVDGFGGSLI